MKKISSIDWIKQKKDYSGRKPRPFPGVNPLRWAIEFRYATGNGMKEFNYFGKPCVQVAKAYQLMCAKYTGSLNFFELDQNGAIAQARANTPIVRGLMVTDWNPHLYQYYYPFSWSEGHVLFVWANLMYRKEIIFEKKHMMVYCPVQKMRVPALIGMVEHHKLWLIDMKSKSLI